MLIDSYMHARQPYSLQLAKKIIEKILDKGYSSMECFLQEGVILFFPFVNIDGYKIYAKTGGNIRKNMNFNNTKRCPRENIGPGVDINRNFPSSFGIIP